MSQELLPTPLRVAVLMATRILSGPGRQLAAVARALKERGVEMHVVLVHRRGHERSPLLDHLSERGVPWSVVEERWPLDTRVIRRVDRLLSDWEPHVLQSHGYKPTIVAAVLTRMLGRPWPWIGFFHGTTTEDLKVRLYHALDLALLRWADRVVVMSREQEALVRGAPDRTTVLCNAVLPQFAKAKGSGFREGRSEGPLVGVVGRLSSEKGVDVLLDAVARLPESAMGRLVVAGDGPERQALERQAGRLGLGNRVRFAGVVDDVVELYRRLDLLVIPSRSEGLPNVLLEALALDVPIVSTRVGAVEDVVGGTAAAVLVPPGDPGALAEGIARVLREGRSTSASAARKSRASAFSLDARARAHLDLYESLMRDVRGAQHGSPLSGEKAAS